MDAIFRVLAEPTRRFLRDRLREHNGEALGELRERLAMARRSSTQHPDMLGGLTASPSCNADGSGSIVSARYHPTRAMPGGISYGRPVYAGAHGG
jgi:hypothetical protein